MRNLIIFLISVFSFQFTNAQEFIETEEYEVTNRIETKEQEYTTAFLDIVTVEEYSMKIATLSITNFDFFEDVTISKLATPNLKNIEEVIKVDINYNDCCTHIDSYYFMITDTSDVISLPNIENTYCDTNVTERQYIFPTQALGKEDTILKTAVNFTETYTIQDIYILESFVWSDDEFNNAVTAY